MSFEPSTFRRLAFDTGLLSTGSCGRERIMSITGRIVNGLVVLPPGIKMPEGAVVKVETFEAVAQDDPLVAAVQQLAKLRAHLPEDYALNHGHYIRGEPKK